MEKDLESFCPKAKCYANTVQNTGNTISTIKDGGVSIMAKQK